MRSIAKMFGRSPFVPLQEHMDKVAECVDKLPELFELFGTGDLEAVTARAEVVSKLEHQADLAKNDIRNSLPRGLFMPVDRANLLEILSLQDTIADKAENIAVLLTFKAARTFEPFRTTFDAFLSKNLETFEAAREVVGQLDELLETGFGGAEADNVKSLVDAVALKEHEADVLQRDLLRQLLAHDDELSYADFFLWTRIIREVSALSNNAEKLANRIRMTLDTK